VELCTQAEIKPAAPLSIPWCYHLPCLNLLYLLMQTLPTLGCWIPASANFVLHYDLQGMIASFVVNLEMDDRGDSILDERGILKADI
jgi:hypothetical protein